MTNIDSKRFVDDESHLQAGQRGVLVEVRNCPLAALSDEEVGMLATFANQLKLSELHRVWYKAVGRVTEKELAKRALASAPRHLEPQCNQARFQDILRQAFKEEEDMGVDEEPELLNHCHAVLMQCASIPDATAFIELHRAICGVNLAAHSDSVAEPSCLARLQEDSGALGLAIGCGFAKAAPMIKKMAADLLEK